MCYIFTYLNGLIMCWESKLSYGTKNGERVKNFNNSINKMLPNMSYFQGSQHIKNCQLFFVSSI